MHIIFQLEPSDLAVTVCQHQLDNGKGDGEKIQGAFVDLQIYLYSVHFIWIKKKYTNTRICSYTLTKKMERLTNTYADKEIR